MGDLASDVARALGMLRHAYAKHNLECPDILGYSNRDDAHSAFPALLGSMEHNMTMSRLPQGNPYEVGIDGFKIRHNVERDPTPVERLGRVDRGLGTLPLRDQGSYRLVNGNTG